MWKLCKALAQTKVHSGMSTPFLALKFHIWLFHTSAVFLHLSLPLSQSWHSPLLRAQLNQWYGDFLILMPGHCCHFCLYSLARLLCRLKRDSNSMLSPPPFHVTSIVTQGFKIWVLDSACQQQGSMRFSNRNQNDLLPVAEQSEWRDKKSKTLSWKCTSWPWTGFRVSYSVSSSQKINTIFHWMKQKYLNTAKSQGWEV